ncbi:MAG TPA: metalloregulator ArsR/SmtB family transcription factor [Candidatus Thermoplasmatota archaeon]|nr:metalloregulator ArsR/SmtB family transcription factor [Candidatus Thermoplasmatota archaeon]
MSDRLTLTFRALADPTRRRILERLKKGDASVQELADPLPISQPAVSKHLKVLEEAGLVTRRDDAQRRYASLRGKPLQEAVVYISEFHRAWEESFSRLDDLLEDVVEEEDARARRKGR